MKTLLERTLGRWVQGRCGGRQSVALKHSLKGKVPSGGGQPSLLLLPLEKKGSAATESMQRVLIE